MSFLRKFTKNGLSAALFTAALTMANGTAMAQCSACVNNVSVPAGNVMFSNVLLNRTWVTDLASTGKGQFSVTLANVPMGNSLSNSTYTGWCAAWFDSTIQADTTASGAPMYSSYAANFPSGFQPIVAGNTFNMVNWILNNKQGNVIDVQNAIWLIMTGVTSPDHVPSLTATNLAAAAKGNPNYIPNAMGVMAVLWQFGPLPLDRTQAITGTELQTVMIEVPVPSVSQTNSCDTCVTSLKVPTTVQYSVYENDYYLCSKSSVLPTSTITVMNAPAGYNVTNKSYTTWYGGWWTSNIVTGRSGFPAYSTYDTNFPAGLKPIVAGNTMNMVNYILNHKQGTSTDIQNAIYKIMVGSAPTALSAASTAMVTAALANATYCPPANGIIAAEIATTTTIGATAAIADPLNMPLIIELVCTTPPPSGTPSLSLKKTAGVAKVNPFQKVTYTYVVTNTGTVTLTNVVVVDDNATPETTKDDFTVGSIPTLAPGQSVTLTASVYPPVQEVSQQDGGDWGGFGSWGHSWDDDSRNSGNGKLICKETPEGNLNITYREDSGHSDNSYGRGSSWDWGWMGHSFQNFVTGDDGAQIQIMDKTGNVVLDFVADYISPSSKTRSGYGTLGVKGGGGMVYKGNVAHVLRCDTSLSRNLNRQTKFNKCTSDSPNDPDWDNEQSYTVEIDKAACANGGFGGVKLPKIVNNRCKQYGDDKHVLHPTSSVATNTATASAVFYGTTVSATAKASVTIDASSSGWSQCSKY